MTAERLSVQEWAMEEARTIAKRSRDPSTQVGCVILRPNNTVASKGYNGFPRGVYDFAHRYEDRQTKYRFTCHAELNAILTAREPLHGYRLYSTLFPCHECAKAIIQVGITLVYAPEPSQEERERWRESFETTELMFYEANVQFEKELPSVQPPSLRDTQVETEESPISIYPDNALDLF